MNKVKHLAFGITGVLLVIAGFISCESDGVTANEETYDISIGEYGGYSIQ